MVDLVLHGGGPMKKAIAQSIRCATLAAVLMIALRALPYSRSAFADQIPAGWEASNMQPIGYSDLNGHGAFKMAIKRVGDKWYLYMGHLWERGWTIVDVTDPANPKVAKHIPGPDNTFTIQMELHDNLMVTAMERMFPTWGGDVDKPFDEGVLVWDISDPLNPKQLSHWKTGSTGAHRIGYPGGKYVNVAAAMPGYKGNILVFLDISDPKNPKEVSRWWLRGQKEGEPSIVDNSSPSPTNPGFHGPAIIDGNTAYLGYGPAIVILDISDITQPRQIGRLDMSPPFLLAGQQGVHDVLKIPGKPLLFSHSETSAENCDTDPLDHVAMIDIKNPAKPRLTSMFPLPVPPAGAPYTNFRDKGGRFGPHNTNLEYHLPDVEKQGELIYLTYFNAGLRIFNIADPRMPKEVGWFIPPQPTKRIGVMTKTKLVQQTEDVLVDTRGNIYITGKQWGLFVLRYTGKGEPAPTAK
jgi:hypothetical protein